MKSEKTFSGNTESCWMEVTPFYPLEGESREHWDVCVVGAGITGLTVAYQLCKEGKSVLVLEMGPVGGGETGRTSAHLSWAIDNRFAEMIRLHGQEKTALLAQSHRDAIAHIQSIVQRENIECDFSTVPGYLICEKGQDQKLLQDEVRASHQIGQSLVHQGDLSWWPFRLEGVVEFPQQAVFHPIKYINGLAQAVEKMGGRIYTYHKVVNVIDAEPKKNQLARVKLADGSFVKASAVVVATNTPINDQFSIHTKQAAYRSYVVGARIPKGSFANCLVWDLAEPYHFLRLVSDPYSPSFDVLLVGGEDHKTGQEEQPEKRFENLEKWVRERFPDVDSFEYHWSGQVFEPVDGVGFIGKNPGNDHIYISTGDSGHGLTTGTIAGLLITDLIMGRRNSWQDLYDPARVTFGSAMTYLKENLNVAYQYGDYLTGADRESIDNISYGEGAVVQQGLRKVAVYKDERGRILHLSPVCTHLGGMVHWNSVEKSWDCPCHGARYSAEGQVICGPAVRPLDVVAPDSDEVGQDQELFIEEFRPTPP